MADGWKTYTVQCRGGLNTSTDTLSFKPGEAVQLVNFEPSKYGGYRRINGFSKYDSAEVPTSGNILGVCVYNGATGGVVAARGVKVYFSSGSGWSEITTSDRTSAGKYRFAKYDYATTKKIAMCDGANYAATWDGTTYTLLNAAGAPTNPKFVTFFLRRLVLAGYSADKQALILTAPDTDDDFQVANGAIELDVRDEITGLKAFRNELYIFGKKTINKLTGTSRDNFAIVPVSDNIGCIAPDSIQEFNGRLIFLAPDGFRAIQGTERVNDTELGTISQPIFTLTPSLVSTAADVDNISSLVVRQKNQYRLFYPTDSQSESDALGILGAVRQGTSLEAMQTPTDKMEWAVLQGIKPNCADSGYIGLNEVIVHGGFESATDAFVFQQESGFSFNSASIPCAYKTPPMYMDDPELRKLLQKLTLYMQVEGDISVTCNTIFDLGSAMITQPTTSMVFEGGSGLFTYGGSSTLYGSATYGGTTQPRVEQNALGSGFLIQFEFTNTGTDPCFSIQAFTAEYRLLGRR